MTEQQNPKIFERYTKIPNYGLLEPETMSLEQKCRAVYFLKESGETISAIMDFMGISRQCVYNYYNKVIKGEIAEFENLTMMELFMQNYRSACEQCDLLKRKANELADSGATTENNRGFAELQRLIIQWEKLKAEWLTKTGLIATTETMNPHMTFKDLHSVEQEDQTLGHDATDEEITESLLSSLMKTRKPLGGSKAAATPLKDMADEPVILPSSEIKQKDKDPQKENQHE